MVATKSELKDSEYYDDIVKLKKEEVDDRDLEKDEENEQTLNQEKENQPQESIVEDSSVQVVEEENDADSADVDNSEALLDEDDLAELRVEDKIPFHKDPKVRLVVVIGLGIASFTLIHLFLTTFTTFDYSFSLAEYQANQEKNKKLQEGQKDDKDEIIEAKNLEIEKLKTREIAQVQEAEIENQEQVDKHSQTSPPVQPQPKPIVKTQPVTASRPVTSYHQPTRVARNPIPTQVAQTPKIEQPKPRIDPEERWRRAAGLGTYGLGGGSSAFVTSNRVTTRATNQTTRQTANPMPTQVAQISTSSPTQTPPVRTIGINSRVEAKLLDDFLLAPQSVAQIELKESLHFNDGSIAIPEQTILLIEFEPENPPTATTIPINKILLPVNGQYRETEVPQGALLVRGRDNKPLKFKTSGGNRGGLGIGDVVGVAGGVLDVPWEVSQTARRVVGSGRSSRTQSTSTMLPKGASIEVYVYQSFALPEAISH